VIVSRWQGSPRDGHGQHQAAGLLTREACQAAGDPGAFTEQARTRLAAYFSLLGGPAPPAIAPVLHEMERQVEAAIEAFTLHDPSASVPPACWNVPDTGGQDRATSSGDRSRRR
jgi:hypothetical protein